MKLKSLILISTISAVLIVAVSVGAVNLTKEEKISAYNAQCEELNKKLDEALYNEDYGTSEIQSYTNADKKDSYNSIRNNMIELNNKAVAEGLLSSQVYTKSELIDLINIRIEDAKNTIDMVASNESEKCIQQREINLMELYVSRLESDTRTDAEISEEYNNTIAKMLAFDETSIPVALEEELLND